MTKEEFFETLNSTKSLANLASQIIQSVLNLRTSNAHALLEEEVKNKINELRNSIEKSGLPDDNIEFYSDFIRPWYFQGVKSGV